jgi:NADH-quinone oxidoreductase subunit M
MAPLVILTILFGVWPGPILETSATSVAALVDHTRAALGPAKSAALWLP